MVASYMLEVYTRSIQSPRSQRPYLLKDLSLLLIYPIPIVSLQPPVYKIPLQQVSKGAKISRFLSLLKACLYAVLKLKGQSFQARRLRGQAILPQFLIKRQQKLQKPKNNYTPFTVWGGSYQLITAVFFRSALILSILIINLRYFIRLTLNSDFLILAQRLALQSHYRTLQMCSSYSNLFLEQIIILSRQAVQKSLRQLKSILFIYRQYIAGPLVSLKGSTLYLYNP